MEANKIEFEEKDIAANEENRKWMRENVPEDSRPASGNPLPPRLFNDSRYLGVRAAAAACSPPHLQLPSSPHLQLYLRLRAAAALLCSSHSPFSLPVLHCTEQQGRACPAAVAHTGKAVGGVRHFPPSWLLVIIDS